MPDTIFSIRDLHTQFGSGDDAILAADGVSLDLEEGQILGVVGESGSGKSVTMMSALRLLPSHTDVTVSGEVTLAGARLLELDDEPLRKLRGTEISVVFQDSLAALNPVLTVGFQIADAVRAHNPKLTQDQLSQRVVELLTVVGIPDPVTRSNQYPHEFSGGMRQRAMIAMAIANNPRVLIADEPTTALDATVQAQVLDALSSAAQATGSAVIMITHDLGVIAEMADAVAVMYAGRIVEYGPVHDVFSQPRHPYTLGLLASIPRLDTGRRDLLSIPGQPPTRTPRMEGCSFAPRCSLAGDRERCRSEDPSLNNFEGGWKVACHFVDEMPDEITRIEAEHGAVVARPLEEMLAVTAEATGAPSVAVSKTDGRSTDDDGGRVLSVQNLTKHYPIRRGLLRKTVGHIRAVDGVDLSVAAGETIGIVGESGSGKSTTARLIMNLEPPTDGSIEAGGVNLSDLTSFEARKSFGKRVQIVFQDPFSSLDPRQTVRSLLAEPMIIHDIHTGKRRDQRIAELLQLVGLDPNVVGRRPRQFSGGQRQRLAIARALAVEPEILILDEPVSALDVSIQAQILNLLKRLQAELGVAYVFISHDLGVVRQISDQILVMYLGKVMEAGPTEDVISAPGHPYTNALLSAVPNPNPHLRGDKAIIQLEGDIPSPANPPSGCVFRTRCWLATDRCAEVDPDHAGDRSASHRVSCHYPVAPGTYRLPGTIAN